MQDYSKYDLKIENYQRKLPHYLQTPGSIIMNQIQLFYDIIKGYKEIVTDLWSHFNLDLLLSEYLLWKDQNPGLNDSDWKYTDLVDKLCKTYDIFREHPVGLLKNSHMIRLLKVRTLGVGFDGTKEKLEELLDALFPKGFEITRGVRYIVQTVTNGSDHATANIYLVRSASDTSFDEIDNDLFEGGYYFLKLLGITLNFISVPEDTLIYDSTVYDDGNNNQINDLDDDDQEIGNKYDEGGNI